MSEKLKRYTCDADTVDYYMAIASGIISGMVDAYYVGETKITEDSMKFSHTKVNKFIQKYAESNGYTGKRLEGAISHLEGKFAVAQDNIWKGADIGVSAKSHHLADLAHHPTPLGLVSSIVVQFLHVGSFVNKDGEWKLLFAKKDSEGLAHWIAPAIITGVLNWLVSLAEKKIEEEQGEEIPKAFHMLAHLIASTPIIIEIAKCANRWFGHLVSDMGGSKNTPGGGMGIPGVFISLLYEIASLPMLKNTGLPKVVNDLYVKHKIDLRHEMAAINAAKKQIIPVLLNEIIVRLGFFIRHLCMEWSEHKDFEKINWSNVVPFLNRTVDRMVTVASMTFTVADTVDAAIHSALDLKGGWIAFSCKFVTRFNYVGAGRVALAIVKEFSNEKKEMQLIHEKRLLMEAKTEFVVQRYEEYKQNLDERLTAFISEDIGTIVSGINYIQAGLESGDSNMVIKGNVMIQRMLGREAQFTTQEEFDELMESDDDFIL